MNALFLDEVRPLPSIEPMERVVAWSVFRSRAEAEHLLEHVHLAPGQKLVGGFSQDSVAAYWWVGVQVAELESWGHSAAVNKRGRLGD